MKRTDADKLRTLVSASLRGEHRYTQKELATKLGVSVRTLRRFKNEPGHKLSGKTLARIHEPVTKLEKSLRTFLRRKFKVPNTPVVQIPKETVLRSGSRSMSFEVSEWDTQSKIDFFLGWIQKLKDEKLTHFKHKGTDYFANWNFRVMTTFKSAERGEVFEEPEDEEDTDVRYYQTPPSSFVGITPAYVREFFTYHDDHYKNTLGKFRGRRVESIYIYIPLKPKGRKK